MGLLLLLLLLPLLALPALAGGSPRVIIKHSAEIMSSSSDFLFALNVPLSLFLSSSSLS
jgi:hypothetical protein